jgi:hypothetical protein
MFLTKCAWATAIRKPSSARFEALATSPPLRAATFTNQSGGAESMEKVAEHGKSRDEVQAHASAGLV